MTYASALTSVAPQDAFERWAALQACSNDATNRFDETADLAFWERSAEGYDAEALATRVPAILERVHQLVPASATVLDVGAGTGAFTLPLAKHAVRVTALDYSPAMLRVLRRKLQAAAAPDNVQVVLARWEDARIEAHDVVFAANALYRVADSRLALTKIVAAARRRGIVVWSVGRQPGSQPVGYQPGPDYVHLVEGLFALDVFAHVELIERVALVWWDRVAE
jgi:2-polyprenyl-3-methyl-5-hydroxy-6-metoxy-1,4-benzoquinol methylase